jgi:hypothetical protein
MSDQWYFYEPAMDASAAVVDVTATSLWPTGRRAPRPVTADDEEEPLIHADRLNSLLARWPIALQAALAVSVPVAVFTALGHPGNGLQAGVGAFTALYAGALPVRERLKVLPLVGLGFVIAGTLGVLASLIGLSSATAGSIATVVGLVAVTIGSTAVIQGFAVGPPGPVFFALVYGASAHITAPVDGASAVSPGSYLALLAGGCAFAVLVAAAFAFLPGASAPRTPRRLRALLPGPARSATGRTAVLRAGTVAALGGGVALIVDVERGYWIVCAGLAVVGAGQLSRVVLKRGVERAAGTVVGAGVYAGIALLAPGGFVLAAILAALQFVVELLVVRFYGIALVFITPLALTIAGVAVDTTDPFVVVGERVVDTFVGVGVAVVSAVIWRDAEAQSCHRHS